jgi:hypothetical protein
MVRGFVARIRQKLETFPMSWMPHRIWCSATLCGHTPAVQGVSPPVRGAQALTR